MSCYITASFFFANIARLDDELEILIIYISKHEPAGWQYRTTKRTFLRHSALVCLNHRGILSAIRICFSFSLLQGEQPQVGKSKS